MARRTPSKKRSGIHPNDCVCAICSNNKSFTPPSHLIEKLSQGEVVLFAGAGISTENKTYCRSTFYEEIQADLGLTDELPFPELMSKFCELPDGRIKLLEKIKGRFDYFRSFDDFYNGMTRFHRAVAPFYLITDVVTTNWDDLFERECDFDSFVYDSDMAFWDASRRRVMKIHGSITNFGSIVATREDYRRSYERLNDGPLGAQLKSLLARKTILYVGYSLSDENYLRLIRNIAKMMNGNIRQSYFVSPTIDRAKLQSAPISLVPVETDGAYFFEQIRETIASRCGLTSDAAFIHCAFLLNEITHEHAKTSDKFIKTQNPLILFLLSYQDGITHALQRILRMHKTGEYYSPSAIHARIHFYENRTQQLVAEGDFWNASYAHGYSTGLLYLLGTSSGKRCPKPPL